MQQTVVVVVGMEVVIMETVVATEVAEEVVVEDSEETVEAMVVGDTKWVEGVTTEMRDAVGRTEDSIPDLYHCFMWAWGFQRGCVESFVSVA
ncbi:hypothetical protein DNTS_027335 [Danionella cerebrum]|uniref:Uncharacterized protein n=1 Tax=Danionella cerebrum TaxID=2873325 RepID=A0A553MXR7_9TELE|nr:hypothetical protein DNTS_027335 [Danionella translucida]